MTAFAYPADVPVSKQTLSPPDSSQQYVYAGVENGDLYRIDIISELGYRYGS